MSDRVDTGPQLVDGTTRLRIWLAMVLVATTTVVVASIGGGEAVAAVSWTRVAGIDAPTVNDGALATDGPIQSSASFDVDAAGNVYFDASTVARIRRIDGATGVLSTVAGTGELASTPPPDGGVATSTAIGRVSAVGTDSNGNVYFGELGFGGGYWTRIRRVDAASGVITTVAGTDGLAPRDIVAFDDGRLLVAVLGQLISVDGGSATAIAGDGSCCGGPAGNGGPAVDAEISPRAIDVAPDGTIFIAEESGVLGGPIRSIDPDTGIIDVLPTDASVPPLVNDIAVKSDASVVFSFNGEVRALAGDGSTTVLAGTGVQGSAVDADGVMVASPGLAVGPADSVYMWDARLQVLTGSGISLVGGVHSASVDGKPAIGTDLQPTAAHENDTRTLIGVTGELAEIVGGNYDVIAGTTVPGYTGDGGPPTSARIVVDDIATGPDGSIYFVDSTHHVVRTISGTSNIISTIAGYGVPASDGIGLDTPRGIAVGPDGIVYVADSGNHRVQSIAPNGVITTFAGTGVAGFAGDGGAPTAAQLSSPFDVAVDGDDVYITDSANDRVRRVRSGTIETVAGDGTDGQTEAGVDPLTTPFSSPAGIKADGGDFTVLAGFFGRRAVLVSGGLTSILPGNWSFDLNRLEDTTRGRALGIGFGVVERVEDDGDVVRIVDGRLLGAKFLDGLVATDTFIPQVTSFVVDDDGALFMVHATAGIHRLQPGAGATFSLINPQLSSGRVIGGLDPATALMNNFSGFDRRDLAGTINLYGAGPCGSSGDGGPAALAEMCPDSEAVADDGTITFLNGVSNWPDPATGSIRRIEGSTGIIETLGAEFDLQFGHGYEVTETGTLYKFPATGSGPAIIEKRTLAGDVTTYEIPYDMVYDLEVAPDGDLLMSVWVAQVGTAGVWDIVRLEPDGRRASTAGFPAADIEIGPSSEVYVAHQVLPGQFNGNGTVIDRLDGLVVPPTTTVATTAPTTTKPTTTTTTTKPPSPTGSVTITCSTTTALASYTTTTSNSSVVVEVNGVGDAVVRSTPGTYSSTVTFEPGDVEIEIRVNGAVVASKSADCSPTSAFETVEPARILETRQGEPHKTVDGLFEGIGRLEPGETVEFVVAGRGGVPKDAAAAMLNVTAIFPDAFGYLTVYPCGEAQPNASNVNYGPSDVVPNAVLARIGIDGKVCIYSFAGSHVAVDVNGYVPNGGSAGTVVPARILETRKGPDKQTIDDRFEGDGPIGAGETLELQVAGRGGVPTDAKAAVLNVTAIRPNANGYVTVYPCGVERPGASNLNFRTGQVVPNAVVATIGSDGKVCIFTTARLDMAVDVNGFVPKVSTMGALSPARLLETRISPTAVTVDGQMQGIGRIKAGQILEVPVAGRGGVPTDAASVFLNVTAVNPSTDGYLTVFPCGTDAPNASNLNFKTGQVVPNAVLAKLGVGGKVCVFTFSELDLLIDVNGFSR